MEYFGFLSLGVTLLAIGLRCNFSMKETAARPARNGIVHLASHVALSPGTFTGMIDRQVAATLRLVVFNDSLSSSRIPPARERP